MNEYLLFKFLIKNTSLDNKDILDIIAMADIISVKKGGEWMPKFYNHLDMGFITEGLIGLFVKEYPSQLLAFCRENEWASTLLFSLSPSVADGKSDYSKLPLIYRAIENTTIYSYTKATLDKIIISYPPFQGLMIQYYQQTLLSSLHHQTLLYTLDAEQRYKNWTDKHPELAQRLPQYLIASYLGILPTSLSRLRNQMHKK